MVSSWSGLGALVIIFHQIRAFLRIFAFCPPDVLGYDRALDSKCLRNCAAQESLKGVFPCELSILLTIPTGLLYAQSFTPTGSMKERRANHTATLLTTGKVLVTGGFPSLATAELYDPSTGTWRYTAHPMQASRHYHTATLLTDGRVLLVGGSSSLTLAPMSAQKSLTQQPSSLRPSTRPTSRTASNPQYSWMTVAFLFLVAAAQRSTTYPWTRGPS